MHLYHVKGHSPITDAHGSSTTHFMHTATIVPSHPHSLLLTVNRAR